MGLRVLHLEDNPYDRELVVETLRAARLDCTITPVASQEEFEGALAELPDLILADCNLPGFDGHTALELACQRCPDVPFVFVSGSIGEERAVASLKRGATDYVLKHNLEKLVPAVRRAIREADDRRQRARVEAELRQLNAELEARVDERTRALTASNEALQSARMEAERANRAKSDFLSRMSHDLRTPLNAILGFAQLLELDVLNAEHRESVRHVLKGGAHLLDLINEVLDIARIESGHLSLSPEPVAIGDIVQHVVELVRPLAARRGIAFDDDAVRVCGSRHLLADRQRLTQILLNLLSNAVKYNRDGGRVRLTCEDVPAGRLRIKVSDTGAGIRPEKLALLFQPFERLGAEQTGIEGTGLGLALSKALAEAMGGTLGVESEVDRGSTFWVELALADSAAETAASPVRAHPHASGQDSGATGTVLYIEDNISNLRLMERLIARRPGIRLVGADQGQAGLDIARTSRPDLILLDLHLPDMHGEEVLRRLWEDPHTRAIPVAVLSADATPAQMKRLRAAGAIAYLTKPLDVSQVLQLLDDTLAKGSQPR